MNKKVLETYLCDGAEQTLFNKMKQNTFQGHVKNEGLCVWLHTCACKSLSALAAGSSTWPCTRPLLASVPPPCRSVWAGVCICSRGTAPGAACSAWPALHSKAASPGWTFLSTWSLKTWAGKMRGETTWSFKNAVFCWSEFAGVIGSQDFSGYVWALTCACQCLTLTQDLADGGVVHVREGLEDPPALILGPHHEGIHWSLYVAWSGRGLSPHVAARGWNRQEKHTMEGSSQTTKLT